MKLALGLRIQHAARQGLDGDGAGWALMQALPRAGQFKEQALQSVDWMIARC